MNIGESSTCSPKESLIVTLGSFSNDYVDGTKTAKSNNFGLCSYSAGELLRQFQNHTVGLLRTHKKGSFGANFCKGVEAEPRRTL